MTAASRTVAGNAASLLAFDGSDGERLGVLIHNHSSTYRLFLKLSRLDAGGAMSATNKHFIVPAEATILIRAGSAVRVWAMNSSGAATTSEVDAIEVR